MKKGAKKVGGASALFGVKWLRIIIGMLRVWALRRQVDIQNLMICEHDR